MRSERCERCPHEDTIRCKDCPDKDEIAERLAAILNKEAERIKEANAD
jgi:hypothetical protein